MKNFNQKRTQQALSMFVENENISLSQKLVAFLRMLKEAIFGNYKIDFKNWAILILGVIYVVSPLDFDFIPVIGWIDDLTVIVYIVKTWNKQLLEYIKWETISKNNI